MSRTGTHNGPRLAPLVFSNAGNGPGPRCGHSLTPVIGDQGPRLILFGGATALEGTGTNSGTSGIRLAGATADVHSFDLRTGEWTCVEPLGEAPSPRAAHAAAAVGNMVVVQGGIGPLGLATEDLHVLDLSGNTARWHRVVVPNSGPGPRYAHVLALVAQRYLVALGGNDGRQALDDVWALDTAAKPYQWQHINPEGESPVARMYATASARADGLLLLCGGREASNSPVGDAYGLARHRDGRWEWARAPGVSPSSRYQHAAVFVGARLHVNGGALGGGRMVDDSAAWAVLDTEAGQWQTWDGAEMSLVTRLCRHACASVGPLIFLYGGLRGGLLLEDMIVADDSWGEGLQERWEAISGLVDTSVPVWSAWTEVMKLTHTPGSKADDNNALPATRSEFPNPNARSTPSSLAEASAAEAAAAAALVRHNKHTHNADNMSRREAEAEAHTPIPRPGSRSGYGRLGMDRPGVGTPPTPDVRLHNRVVVVAAGAQRPPVQGGLPVDALVRQLSLDQFENEGRRVRDYNLEGEAPTASETQDLYLPLDRPSPETGVHKRVIASLLRPRDWTPPMDRKFFLDVSAIQELCSAAEACFKEEPTVLRLGAPIKIFGDLHGQFGDLMRLFHEYGSPSTAGDIAYIDYLFLGDYVDRGSHSLETIMLLLALKVEYPNSVHLIRGNHEAADINAQFGFRLECVERLGEQGLWVWQRLNSLFNYLPLAAVIEGKILCMHGGIGRSMEYIHEIEALQRPLTMENGGLLLMDLLWSDPTENDRIEGVHPNARGPGLVSFGPDRVHHYCEANELQLIVRAHECVMDGFERFAQGRLITVFSATNYCGTANNAGAILVIGRDLVVVPKLIHPLPPQAVDDSAHGQTPSPDWMETINRERPPTPPRGRPASRNQSNSLAWI
mmetsp:Transcript_3467/g.7218  ORF Transcript_3467/g.7218 Transcript_3467/m.7218 type:complete len:903 (-) Transcript_3467:555-3263(-)